VYGRKNIRGAWGWINVDVDNTHSMIPISSVYSQGAQALICVSVVYFSVYLF
jgi:hypothetical protein